MRDRFFLLLPACLCVVSPSVDSPIIVRHDRADSLYVALGQRFSSLVQLQLLEDVPDGHGVLIDPEWVLTAAHVAVELDVGHAVSISDREAAVAEVIVHPEWNDGPNDLALIRLMGPVGDVKPARPYRARDEQGEVIYLAGAGDTGNGLTGPTGNDRQVRAATNRIDEVSEFWLKFRFDDPTESPDAATEYEGISGPGDSGGPAYLVRGDVHYVVGVSSGQSTSATGGAEGVYGVTEYFTRISSYSKWIDDVMGSR